MNKLRKQIVLFFILGLLLFMNVSQFAMGNSAEPPSLVILVNNPPKDLRITLVSSENKPEAKINKVAWEGYYVFYSRDLRTSSDYTFQVTANGKSFLCNLGSSLHGYNNVYTLDISKQQMTPGKYPFRSVLLVSLRVLITLVLEGLIFWILGFREKRSWIVFLIINLITQGALNIWLNIEAAPMPSSYLIFGLIFAEFFVFLTEMIAFPIFIDEYKKGHIILSTFFANFISLIVGGYIITLLPV